ncbi:NUDIX hydrolase [Microbacterium paraoxydans]|uniref:NUDIX hydrolase n=1 Tax=Microbacterium paraoxydans TaxID=199592 RepID=A0ABS5IRM5_9MICO|nr:NUDIX hydrolase [Microbacterium paraoxydans]MBS0025619.1 NUDIX hydrolase [Microbacterium paraoxydans]
MSDGFTTVYDSSDGLPVRLEAARRHTADGAVYTHHRLVVSDGRTGAVIVARDGDRLLLVLSARDAVGADLWEFPRGAGEAEETAVETALRELQEETGLRGVDPCLLGDYVTDSSIFPQRVAVVECRIDADAPRTIPDGEVSDRRWITVEDLADAVRDGTVRDAHTLAAITVLSSRKEL